jgi:phage shock protein E
MPNHFKPYQFIYLWRDDGWTIFQHVSKGQQTTKQTITMVEQIILNGEGTIIDVRTRAEFQSGHPAGAVNIPVNELMTRLEEIKSLKAPFVLCCASGGRSAMANMLLKQQGIDSHDAGSWHNVNYLQAQTV